MVKHRKPMLSGSSPSTRVRYAQSVSYMCKKLDIACLQGYIASCSTAKLCLHTINARHITALDLASPPLYATVAAPITSMAFHERDYSHLGVLATGASDGSITLRTWTADGTPEGETAQWEFLTIRIMKVRTGKGAQRPPSVTALKFLG